MAVSFMLQRSALSVVEVWKHGCYLCKVRQVTKAGLRVILASPWYLDLPGPTHNWARYYTVWPLAFPGQKTTRVLWFAEIKLTVVMYTLQINHKLL